MMGETGTLRGPHDFSDGSDRIRGRTIGAALAGARLPGTLPGARCGTHPGPGMEAGRSGDRRCAGLPDAGASMQQGVDTAYYLVHAMGGGEEGFEARDLYAAQNFGRAAQEAGVRRIIYLGGLGRDEDELSPHLRKSARGGGATAQLAGGSDGISGRGDHRSGECVV